ncbi:mothers against decapentaplegic 7 isoform 3-like protein [Camelus ferus]|nr:mothers against decapentaplegic 7 isoform 3-like protein [Camelus ferus]
MRSGAAVAEKQLLGYWRAPVATCLWAALSLGFIFAISAKRFQWETGNAHPRDILLVARGGRTGICTIHPGVFGSELGNPFPELAFLYGFQFPTSSGAWGSVTLGNGFCLGQLNSDNKSQLVQKVRSKIGCGIQLTREVDGVWVYNRSSYPIFIKSATLDNPDSRTLLVHKVFPGFSIKAFDYEKAFSLQRPNDHEFMQQPWTGFTVQISFVKGWGQCYTRQFISSCPCWLEVIFNSR